MKRIHQTKIFSPIALAIILAGLFVFPARAQQRDAVLEDALINYSRQNYAGIIKLLTENPPAGFTGNSDKILAYELLAASYLYIEQTDSAKTALGHLIVLAPDYAPASPPQTAEFLNLVAEVKRMSANKGKSKKWYWIGGAGVSAAAVTLYFLLRGGKKELPEAPDPPGVQ